MVTGVIVCAAVLAAATAFGIGWRARNGRLRAGAPRAGGAGPAPGAQPGSLTRAELGAPLGDRATLVQFSTAFCAPCRATRVILAGIAAEIPGVSHVEVDAESRLDLVRRLGIRRTPAVLVLGPDGGIVRRGSGQPREADVLAALGEVTRRYK